MMASQGPPTTSVDFLVDHRKEWGDNEEETEEQERVSQLPESARMAVYEQKYTMFRHFDSLRWQIPGLVFAVGGFLIGFAPRTTNGLPHYLALFLYSGFALVGSYVMYRIRYNLRKNNRILRRFAISLGDYGILPHPGMESASTWMHVLIVAVGVASLALGINGWLHR